MEAGMTNHPHRSNLARSIDELSAMISRTQRDLTAALDGQAALRRELQLAAMFATPAYMDDGHGARIARKYAIDLHLSEVETDLLALDLTEIPLAIELCIEEIQS